MSIIKPKPLPPRIEKFVAEFMADGCASAAAIRAGYSAATSKQAGCRLLRRGDVKEALRDHRQRLVQQQAQQVQQIVLDGQRTRQVIAYTAYFDVRAFVNSDGSAKNLHELDAQSAAAVAGFEISEGWVGKGKARRKVVTTKVRLVNKVAALDVAARITGEFVKDHEQRRAPHDMSDQEILDRIDELLHKAGLPKPSGTLQ